MLECTNISPYAAAIRLATTGLPRAMPDALAAGLPEFCRTRVFPRPVTADPRKPVLPACSGRMSVSGLPAGRPQNKLLQFFWNGAIMVPNKFNSGKTPIET